MPIEYDRFFNNISSSTESRSLIVPSETGNELTQCHLRHVYTYRDPRILRNLILAEQSRTSDQEVNLTSPTTNPDPSQLVGWKRLKRMYHCNRLYIRMTKRCGEPVVLLMYPEDRNRFGFFSTDLQDLKNWTLIPPFVKELINPQEESDTGSYSRYALLVCNDFHGWELVGCISALTPCKQASSTSATSAISFLNMKRAVLPPPTTTAVSVSPTADASILILNSSL